MKKTLFPFSYKIFFAFLTLFAVGFQYLNDSQTPNFSSLNFFSYFTIESNIILSLIFLVSAVLLLFRKTSTLLDLARGACVLYMVTTGIVYYILLYHLPDPNRIVWVNTILHLIAPVVGLFDWFFDPAKQIIPFKKTLLWLIFPLVYVVYSLIRGSLTNWYPYSFLNPTGPGGFQTVITYAVVISLGVVFGGFLISKIRDFAWKI